MVIHKFYELFQFHFKDCKTSFNIRISDFGWTKTMLLMLHYDVWQSAGGFDSLEKSINQIGKIKFSLMK
jgi:hypothetical protein